MSRRRLPSTADIQPPSVEGQELPQTRRQTGGARREATERITIRAEGFETTAWTLNMSRGGVRLVVEDPVSTGSDYELVMSDDSVRTGRVVWVRNEADGQIVGLQFLDIEGSVPPPPDDGDGR